MRCSQCNVILPPEVVILQLLLIGPVTHNCHTPAKGRNWTKISPDTHSWLILRSVWRIDQGARAVVSCTSIIHADIMFGNVTRVEKKKKRSLWFAFVHFKEQKRHGHTPENDHIPFKPAFFFWMVSFGVTSPTCVSLSPKEHGVITCPALESWQSNSSRCDSWDKIQTSDDLKWRTESCSCSTRWFSKSAVGHVRPIKKIHQSKTRRVNSLHTGDTCHDLSDMLSMIIA